MASVENNMNISKRKGNLRHPSTKRVLELNMGITFVYIFMVTEDMNQNRKQKAFER